MRSILGWASNRRIDRTAVFLCVATLWAACSRPADPLDRAERALEEGRFQEAYRLAEELTAGEAPPESRPTESAEAWIVLARAALATMRTSPGVAAAARAVEIAPQDPRAHHVKALLDQRRRRNIAAVAAAREAVRLAPGEAAYHMTLGELLWGGGMVGTADYSASEEAFREATRLDPKNARARYGLGKTLVLAGRNEEGAIELGTYVVEEPFHGDAFYHRGLARLRTRDFEGAASDFRRATLLPPQSAHAFFNLANALQRLGKKDEAEEVRRNYQTLHAREMELEAIETSYHSQSDNVTTAFALVERLTQARRYDEAKTILLSLSADNPRLPRPPLLLAEVALADLDWDTARLAAERALEVSPQSAPAHLSLSRAAAEGGDRDTALDHARRAAEADPSNIECAIALGELLLEAKRFAEAAKVFTDARGRFPQDPRMHSGLGRALLGEGRAADAEAALSTALRARPRSAEWLTARGLARVAQEKTSLGEEDFRTALAIAPNHAPAHHALSSLLSDTGRGGEAKERSAAGNSIVDIEKRIAAARREFHRRPRERDVAKRLADLLRQADRDVEADYIEGRATLLREML